MSEFAATRVGYYLILFATSCVAAFGIHLDEPVAIWVAGYAFGAASLHYARAA